MQQYWAEHSQNVRTRWGIRFFQHKTRYIHHHGISMTTMQFPSNDSSGQERNVAYDLSLDLNKV